MEKKWWYLTLEGGSCGEDWVSATEEEIREVAERWAKEGEWNDYCGYVRVQIYGAYDKPDDELMDYDLYDEIMVWVRGNDYDDREELEKMDIPELLDEFRRGRKDTVRTDRILQLLEQKYREKYEGKECPRCYGGVLETYTPGLGSLFDFHEWQKVEPNGALAWCRCSACGYMCHVL